MKISRRDFLKWSAAATVALKLNYDLGKFNDVLAAETDPPVIWLQGACCSGCSVSFLDVTNPTTVEDVLINKISLKYNSTLNTAAGETVMQAIEAAVNAYNGQFILVIEGAIPTGANTHMCILGEVGGVPLTLYDALISYGAKAKYIVAAGTCSSYGGPQAKGDSSFKTVLEVLGTSYSVPIVNLPGCPVHPTILTQTLIDVILTGVPALTLDHRPVKFYGASVHSACPRIDLPKATEVGQPNCFMEIGCWGPHCENVCPSQKWNSGRNWCVTSNYPCIGCANSDFPSNPLTN